MMRAFILRRVALIARARRHAAHRSQGPRARGRVLMTGAGLVAESQALAAFAPAAAVQANVGVVAVGRLATLADPDRRELLCSALHGIRPQRQNRRGPQQKQRPCRPDSARNGHLERGLSWRSVQFAAGTGARSCVVRFGAIDFRADPLHPQPHRPSGGLARPML